MIRIAAVQMKPAFGEVLGNRDRTAALMRSNPADLYVLPELYNTGYLFSDREEALSLAEPYPAGDTPKHLAELSSELKAVIVAGFAESTPEGKVHNSAAIFDRGVPLACYRKIHLFDLEFRWAEPGNQPPAVIQTGVGRIGPMICFDWIFPETTRCLALGGAQIIAHCANLVLPYCQDAMVTRCLENRVFAVTANRIGAEARGDDELHFTGSSQITGHRGARLIRASEEREEVIVAEITPALADDKQITAANHVVSDRRPGLYGQLWQ